MSETEGILKRHNRRMAEDPEYRRLALAVDVGRTTQDVSGLSAALALLQDKATAATDAELAAATATINAAIAALPVESSDGRDLDEITAQLDAKALTAGAFNARDAAYGAIGDGVADDTAAIQAAIDAASSAFVATGARQHVVIPTGIYKVAYAVAASRPAGYAVDVAGALRLRSGVTVRGSGAQTTIQPPALPATTLTSGPTLPIGTLDVTSTAGFASSGQLQFAGTTSVVTYTAKTSTSFTGCTGGTGTLTNGVAVVQRAFRAVLVTDFAAEPSNFSVENLRIAGSMTQAVELLDEGIMVGPSTDWLIDRCEITGVLGKAIHAVGESTGAARRPTRWTVSRCYLHHIGGNAIGYSQNGAKDFQIVENRITDSLIAGGAESVISGTTTNIDNGRIVGNLIREFGDISAAGRDMLVAQNTIEIPNSALGPGIKISNGARVRVLDNMVDCLGTASTLASGIRATDSLVTGLVIKGNTVRRADGSGITVQAGSGAHTDVVIANNVIHDGAAYVEADIVVQNATEVVITGNTTRNALGIYARSNAARVSIANNICKGSRVQVEGVSCSITGNVIEGPATTNVNAIRVTAAGASIVGNRLKGGATNGATGTLGLDSTDCVASGNVVENATTGQKWAVEGAGGDRNLVTENTFIGTGSVTKVGAASVIRRNRGYTTENGGSASIADGGTIAHGLSTTPTRITLTPAVASRHVSGVPGASNITVALKDTAGTAVAAAETVYWTAEA